MKWLTVNDVRLAARKSRREALIYSFIHWTQLVQATRREIKTRSQVYFIATMCGMCVRYDFQLRGKRSCRSCKLACLTKEKWHDAYMAFGNLWTPPMFPRARWQLRRWKRWQKAANVMRNHIAARLKKEYGIDGRSLRGRI